MNVATRLALISWWWDLEELILTNQLNFIHINQPSEIIPRHSYQLTIKEIIPRHSYHQPIIKEIIPGLSTNYERIYQNIHINQLSKRLYQDILLFP